MKKTKKLSLWLTFALILCGAQLLVEFMVSVMLIMTHMLSGGEIALAVLAFLLLFFLVFLLVFWIDYQNSRKEKKGKAGSFLRRGAGTVISAIVICLCIFSTTFLDQAMETLRAVTGMGDVQYENICVYVLKDDPAESVEDARDYQYGITLATDPAGTREAVSQINESIGTEISADEYEDNFSMIDSLYSGQSRAIIMNEAYVDVIEELDKYQTFEDDTKVLHFLYVAQETTEEETVEEKTQIDITRDPFVVYISGSDTRNTMLTTSRSDVNILAVVNPQTRNILLISTPRDYYVPISIGAGAKDKLTHCGIYGTHCSMDTLADLYGIDVDYYAQINFTGFESLVDAIGGVDVYSDTEGTIGGKYFTVGYNTVNGEQALAFARERHKFDDGDRARGRHQMALISAIVTKMTSSTALITNYSAILDSLQGMFATDVSSEEISELVKMQLSDPSSWNIKSYSVTGSDANSTETYSMPGQSVYVMIPDDSTVEKAQSLIRKVTEGVTILDTDVE